MKNKKRNIFLLSLMILLLLTGCYSLKDIKQAKKYREQGKINAINYIKIKYGFEPEIISVKAEKECEAVWGCLDSWPSGKVNVKAINDKKKFNIYISGAEESIEGTDSYQLNDIENDLIKFFRRNIQAELYDYELKFYVQGIKEYYNNNLEDFIPYIGNIKLYYIGENNLNNLDINPIKNMFHMHNGTLLMINFKNKNKYNQYKSSTFKSYNNSYSISQNDKEEEKSIYKDNALEIENNKITYYNYNVISNYNNEFYIYPSKYRIQKEYKISIDNLDNINNYKKKYSTETNIEIEPVSKTYSITNTSSDLLQYIYFPKNTVNIKNNDNIFLASECYQNNEKIYYINDYNPGRISNIISDDNYYVIRNYISCDYNSKVKFTLIKINTDNN